jgi:membrane protein YdbS with pleckstrin-like domain
MITPQVYPPRVEAEPQLHRLEGRVVWHWGLTLFAETAGLVVALLVFGRFVDQWIPVGPLTAAVAVIGLALALLLPPARLRSWGYQLRERDLYVRRGVLSRAISVIPLARIQHVDTRQDLVERWLGLGRVVVYTAGIRGAELTIPGLAADEAEALRDRLAALSGVEHAV